MLNHPDLQYPLARARLDDALADAAHARLVEEARRASPDFIPPSRWRDTAFWASLIGPVIGVGFLTYFAQEIGRAVIQ